MLILLQCKIKNTFIFWICIIWIVELCSKVVTLWYPRLGHPAQTKSNSLAFYRQRACLCSALPFGAHTYKTSCPPCTWEGNDILKMPVTHSRRSSCHLKAGLAKQASIVEPWPPACLGLQFNRSPSRHLSELTDVTTLSLMSSQTCLRCPWWAHRRDHAVPGELADVTTLSPCFLSRPNIRWFHRGVASRTWKIAVDQIWGQRKATPCINYLCEVHVQFILLNVAFFA